jgi:4-hydroxythreonine-4-phosphate dehydrogenase
MVKKPESAGSARHVLGLSIGDPAGIGPEIAVKALSRSGLYKTILPVIYADRIVLEDALEVTGIKLDLHAIDEPAEALGRPGTLDYIGAGGITKKGEYSYGAVSEKSGEAAFRYVVNAIAGAMAGKTAGVVTGPISKEAINLAGHHYAGHTELFAEYTGTKTYGMLLCSGDLRVIHATTHVSLRRACDLITKERVLDTIRLARKALRLMGKEKGRIAVAGLNPHSSENGLFGDEEERCIIPAVEAARAEGFDVTGPVPPDTVFVKALGGIFDLVVAMYHDQGHIPLKLSGFRMDPVTGSFTLMSGINATIGLPVIRTSVDHGTAFDKAGKNEACEGSLIEAFEMAAIFAENWGSA